MIFVTIPTTSAIVSLIVNDGTDGWFYVDIHNILSSPYEMTLNESNTLFTETKVKYSNIERVSVPNDVDEWALGEINLESSR